MRNILCLMVVLLWAGQGYAGGRQAMIDQIIAGGSNETEQERHTVEVNGCTMTT